MSNESSSIILKSHNSTDQIDSDFINKDSLTSRVKDNKQGVNVNLTGTGNSSGQ